MSISLCGSLDVNTGAIACDDRRGNPSMLILGSAEFAPADYADTATFDAALIAKTKLARNSAEKLYPMPVIQGVTTQTEAAKYGTMGYGLKVKIARSKPGYEFDMLPGTTLEKQLIKFDGRTIPGFILDDNGILWGKQDNEGNFSGINYLVGVEAGEFGDGNNVKPTKVTISIIDAKDNVENLGGVVTDATSADMVGLNDVTLTEEDLTSNVAQIKGEIKTTVMNNTVNLAETYGATLAVTGLWSAATGAPDYGTPLAITSVAVNADGLSYDITFNSAAFTALASSTKIRVNLASPATLDAADVTEIEGVAVIITKP
jgi:hypothetical protein